MDIKTTENKKFATNLGNYAKEGGPGRPRGSLNKFTQIKNDMLEVWIEEDGKEKFRQLFKGTERDFLKALGAILALLPKEPTAKLEQSSSPVVRIVHFEKSGKFRK